MKIEDDNIYFRSEEELPDLPMLGFGSQGTVYYDGTKAYKYFAFDVYKEDRDLEKYKYFRNIKLADFSFPEKLIFVGNRFYGYTMPYFKGNDLDKEPFENSFTSLKKYMKQSEKSVKPLAEYKIKIRDMYTANIVKLNKFKFIDIDSYSYKKTFSYDECFEGNIKRLGSLCSWIVRNSLGANDWEITSLIDSWSVPLDKGKISYMEFLDTVQSNLSEIAGREITTLKQGTKVLRYH